MKYLDFIGQTVLILLGVGVAILSIFKVNEFAMILWAQLLLGPWQIVSSIITTITKKSFYKAKRKYLITSGCYLLAITLTFNIELTQDLSILFMILPAWTLAFYYYILTLKWVRIKNKKGGKFLPHLSF